MKFSEYITENQVFTTASLMAAVDSPAAAEEQLRLAVSSGAVERVRRGLLVSNRGLFQGSYVDPAAVVSAADPRMVLSYHSALEAHGVAHNMSAVCQFRSDAIRSGFVFRGVRYQPCGDVGAVEATVVRGQVGRRRVTSRERTVVDCLGRPSLCGGVEEAVRSLTAFVYLDVGSLVELAVQGGPAACARVGWLLSQKRGEWHVTKNDLVPLSARLGKGPYRLGRCEGGQTGWSPEWRLVLPEENREVETWLTHP